MLNDKVEPSAIKGKIVLIGVSATGVDIPQVTPLDTKMSTATLAANALHNLLTGGFITRSGMMGLAELVILVLVGCFLSLFAAPAQGPVRSPGLGRPAGGDHRSRRLSVRRPGPMA